MSKRTKPTIVAFLAMASLAMVAPGASAAEPIETRNLIRLRAIPYIQRQADKLLADVYMPPGKGPFPGVLMVHGGAWATGSKWNVLVHANEVARHGYTVVAINYRLAPRYKHPAQIEDCRAALRWMRSNAAKYKIDPKRVAAYGYSAGGHLASLLALTGASQAQQTRPADKKPRADLSVQAVVAGGAPCDFRSMPDDSKVLAYFLGGTRSEKPDAYREASPTSHVRRNSPPFFFYHGVKDRIVPCVSSSALFDLLRSKGVDATMHLIPDKGHLGTFIDTGARAKAIVFLDRVLKGSSR